MFILTHSVPNQSFFKPNWNRTETKRNLFLTSLLTKKKNSFFTARNQSELTFDNILKRVVPHITHDSAIYLLRHFADITCWNSTNRQCKTLKTKPEDHYMQTKKYLATAEKLCNAFNPEWRECLKDKHHLVTMGYYYTLHDCAWWYHNNIHHIRRRFWHATLTIA